MEFNELTGPGIRRTLSTIMHHVERGAGRVLSSTFKASMEPMIVDVLKRVDMA
jgi:hypothetical protein